MESYSFIIIYLVKLFDGGLDGVVSLQDIVGLICEISAKLVMAGATRRVECA